jgi:protein-S-isoprenylcysteine O-methyltransferase Ste14
MLHHLERPPCTALLNGKVWGRAIGSTNRQEDDLDGTGEAEPPLEGAKPVGEASLRYAPPILQEDGRCMFYSHEMCVNFLKSLLHNIGVVAVGFAFAFLGARLDLFFGINRFESFFVTAAALVLLVMGFLLRVWATFYFYQQRMKVISLVPQNSLITTGPYRFSRNPLYLGGNVFIFFGATLFLGSPSGIFLTVINILAVDIMIRREEKLLERIFGEEFVRYRRHVRRWL